MAHFMIAHLQNGEYHGNRILSAATAEMMHNSPLTVLAAAQSNGAGILRNQHQRSRGHRASG
jgi:hypothetical protein